MSSFFEAEHHRNVMEVLVQEEIARQTAAFSPEELEYVNLVEVTAYALNRLPPLYATSHEGFYRQLKLGREQMVTQLRAVIRKGLRMVSDGPPRLTTPLKPVADLQREEQSAQAAFTDLAEYLTELTQPK